MAIPNAIPLAILQRLAKYLDPDPLYDGWMDGVATALDYPANHPERDHWLEVATDYMNQYHAREGVD